MYTSYVGGNGRLKRQFRKRVCSVKTLGMENRLVSSRNSEVTCVPVLE